MGEEGYRRKSTILRLVWPKDSIYAGLVVRARTASLGQLFDISELASGAERITSENLDTVKLLYKTFADRLVSWNYQDETGRPIEPTAENLHKEEHPFVMALVYAWLDAVQGVIKPDGPLDSGDTPPGPPDDVPLPMELLTPEQ